MCSYSWISPDAFFSDCDFKDFINASGVGEGEGLKSDKTWI